MLHILRKFQENNRIHVEREDDHYYIGQFKKEMEMTRKVLLADLEWNWSNNLMRGIKDKDMCTTINSAGDLNIVEMRCKKKLMFVC